MLASLFCRNPHALPFKMNTCLHFTFVPSTHISEIENPSLHTLALLILHLLRSNLGSKSEKLLHPFPIRVVFKQSENGLTLHSIRNLHPLPTFHITYSPFLIHNIHSIQSHSQTPNTTPFLSILSHFTEIISSSPCHTHLHHSWRSHFTLGELAPKVTLKGSSTQFAPRGSSFS